MIPINYYKWELHTIKELYSSIRTNFNDKELQLYLPIMSLYLYIHNTKNSHKIIDFKNNSGWIHISQLKKSNSIISLEDKILFKNPSNFSRPLAKIKKGKVLVLKKS